MQQSSTNKQNNLYRDLPLVSVIIPCYNSENYISQAVESALQQTYKNIEVIVIDDGSVDNSYAILKSYNHQIKLLIHPEHKNMGVSFTRKAGINEAKGQWIAFLDADDVWDSQKIEHQVKKLENFPEAILCHTKAKVVYDEGLSEKDYKNDFSISEHQVLYRLTEQASFLKSNNICNSSVLVRKDNIQNVSFEAPQLFQFEDWLLWILLSQQGFFLFLPEETTFYRYHTTSSTAKILSNELRTKYSQLELLLTLVSRIDDEDRKEQLVHNIHEVLRSLLLNYNPALPKADYEKIVSILVGDKVGEFIYLENEIIKHKELQKSLNEKLRLYQSSRLHQVIEKISFWRK